MPERPRNRAPIGLFDSGLGGLTVLRALERGARGHHFVYLGDTARLPYGTKDAATVQRYAVRCTEHLVRAGVGEIIIACNTASAWALEHLRSRFELPMTGVIEPSAAAAVAVHREGAIAVLATPGTVNSGAYTQAIVSRAPGSEVIAIPAPVLVALAEEGWTAGPVVDAALEAYLAPLAKRRVDTLVLGCTHFPLMSEAIGTVARRLQGNRPVHIVSSADAVASGVRRLTLAGTRGVCDLRLTDTAPRTGALIERFLAGSALRLKVRQVGLDDTLVGPVPQVL